MDKQFDGLIHTKIQALTTMPQYQSNYYTKEELDNIIKTLKDKINNIDFIDEEELKDAFDEIDIISGGDASSEEGE